MSSAYKDYNRIIKSKQKICLKKKHLWKSMGYGAEQVNERCSRCHDRRDRDATKEEKRAYRKWSKSFLKTPEIHKLAHAFDRAMKDKSGYEMMLAAEKWEKRYPGRIMITGVDDAAFAGSDLI